MFEDLITGREGSEVLWSAYMSVCPLAYLKNDLCKLHEMFCRLPVAGNSGSVLL